MHRLTWQFILQWTRCDTYHLFRFVRWRNASAVQRGKNCDEVMVLYFQAEQLVNKSFSGMECVELLWLHCMSFEKETGRQICFHILHAQRQNVNILQQCTILWATTSDFFAVRWSFPCFFLFTITAYHAWSLPELKWTSNAHGPPLNQLVEECITQKMHYFSLCFAVSQSTPFETCMVYGAACTEYTYSQQIHVYGK